MRHDRQSPPVPRIGRERIPSFEEFARDLRKRANARLNNFTPFADPEGEDRDERRVTTWDFSK